MTTGFDDQQLPVTGEEGVSEASDVDEPANAEGQFHIAFLVQFFEMGEY